MNREEIKELALKLTDLEFELLLRDRITYEFRNVHLVLPGLGESHNRCTFNFNWHDKSQWRVELGATYSDGVSLSGEVLRTTVQNAGTQYEMQHRNKLSLLLPAPEVIAAAPEVIESADADEMPF